MKKLSVLLVAFALVAVCLFLLPTEAQAATSGTCGENLTWTLNDEGTLTISGTGRMYYYNYDDIPWYFWKDAIQTVIIEDGVTDISPYAFADCENLTSIEIPEGVTSINWFMFKGCSALTTIKIPTTVTIIFSEAFYGCSSLTSIEIPEGVTDIYSHAFYGCSSLKSIEIPEGVTSIADSTFWECTALTTIEIPTTVTIIGDWAFYGCSGLTTINVPYGVTSIERNTFCCCSGLTSIDIPNTVTSIGEFAFSDCSALTTINIPYGVESIEPYTFSNCSGLTSIDIPNTVTSIGDGAFGGCSSLTSIDIPDTVMSIGGFAFDGCSSLTSIDIPEGVTSIEDSTFLDCISLTTINVPTTLTNISYRAFMYCSGLTSIEIPEGVTRIGFQAFIGCSNLKSIEIPEGVTSIEDSTFFDCIGLTTIKIPTTVTSIGGSAFSGCSSLKSIEIPEGVTSIGGSAFLGCSNLKSIEIPEGVTSIEDYTFFDCRGLTTIKLPTTLTNIGVWAFLQCSSLESVDIPVGVTSIGKQAFMSSGLTSIEIPNTVISIGDEAFCQSDLTSIEIPEGITSIAVGTFSSCSALKTITLPQSIAQIDDRAFSCCSDLESVIYKGTWNDWNMITIGEENTDLTDAVLTVYCEDSISHTWIYGETIKEALCSSEGLRVVICDVCGFEATEVIDKLTEHSYSDHWEKVDESTHGRACNYCRAYETAEHTWDENGWITVSPTCTNEGEMTFYCKFCSAKKVEPIPMEAHYYHTDLWVYVDEESHAQICYVCGHAEAAPHGETVEWVSVDPTCKNDGEKTYSCTDCHGVVKTEPIPMRSEHSYFGDSWENVDDDYHKQICFICGYEDLVLHDWDESYILSEPTCNSEGWMSYHCALCDATKGEIYADKLTKHSYNGWIKADEDTHKQVCWVCGHEETEIHTWDYSWESKCPTCAEEGEMTYSCTTCGAEKTEPIEMLSKHSFYNWEKVDEDTHKQVCWVCGYEEAETHNWDDGRISKDPTCAEEGETIYFCFTCVARKTEPIEKLTKHSYNGWIEADEDTHKHVCWVCGHEETGIHNWDNSWESKSPTCAEEGETTYSCSTCSAYKTEPIEKLTEHSYSSWVLLDNDKHKQTCLTCGHEETEDHNLGGGISIHPTCATEGEMTYSCIICLEIIRTEPIPKLTEHIYSGWDEVDDLTHQQACHVCGEIGAVEPHEWWRDYEFSDEPTCLEPGYIYYYCGLCDCEKTEEVEALGHSYEYGICTGCGESDPDYVPSTEPTEPPVEPSEPTTEPSVEPSEPTTEPQLDELGTKLAELEAIIVNLADIPEKEEILRTLASARDSIELPLTEESLNAALAVFDDLGESVVAAYPEEDSEVVLGKIAEIKAIILELLPEDDIADNFNLFEKLMQLIMDWISKLLAIFGL